uniref:Uncharacterized protein n=1 Tax=Glossina pallidipes TaxID=7398 RepID=A0A1B0AAA0_GLOPL
MQCIKIEKKNLQIFKYFNIERKSSPTSLGENLSDTWKHVELSYLPLDRKLTIYARKTSTERSPIMLSELTASHDYRKLSDYLELPLQSKYGTYEFTFHLWAKSVAMCLMQMISNVTLSGLLLPDRKLSVRRHAGTNFDMNLYGIGAGALVLSLSATVAPKMFEVLALPPLLRLSTCWEYDDCGYDDDADVDVDASAVGANVDESRRPHRPILYGVQYRRYHSFIGAF